jgi:cell division GTPase FtsZ
MNMSTGEIETVAKREYFVNMLVKGMTEPKIAVVGIGGAGSNIISSVHSGCKNNVHTVAINTDEASLQKVNAHTKLLVGKDVTQGKGTNGFPEVGEFCGECAKDAIRDAIRNKDIVFVVAGMGGGTGTGIAPIVAKISKEMKSFTFIIAVNPFSFEKDRAEKAKEGVNKLKAIESNTYVVENDILLKSAENLPLSKAFGIIDRNVIKMIDTFCAQANQTFLTALRQEIDQVMDETYTARPEPVQLPEIIVTSVPTMACEAKLESAAPMAQMVR